MTRQRAEILGLALLLNIAGGVTPSAALAAPDRTPPAGSIKINNGAASTTNRTVTLTLSAQDTPGGSGMVGGKAGMQIRNDNPRKWPKNGWEPYRTTKTWTLLAGDGPKTVYVKFRDKAGNAMRPPVNASIVVDTTPPTTPVVVDDGRWATSLTTLHATWTSSDPESGIVEYQYAIGTSVGGADIVPWTPVDLATEITHTGLTLTHGTTYYISVKALNQTGAWSAGGVSDGITVDPSPPTTPVVTDDGETSPTATSLHASWTASDPESGIAEYQHAIGTSAGTTDVVTWTSAGTATEVTHRGIRLTKGNRYFVSVKAVNAMGLWSAVGTSDGLLIVNSPLKLEPIGDKLIRVQPPGATAQGATVPPPSGTHIRTTAAEDQTGPQILLLKLKAHVTTPFETIVRAGQRLRARASPAHLKRLSAPTDQRSRKRFGGHPPAIAASQAFSLEELCARHQIQRSEPLFKTPSPRTGGVQTQGLSPQGTVPDVGLDRIFRIEVPRERVGDALREFSQHPDVEYCEPRLKMEAFMTPNDPYLASSGSWGQSYPDLWGLKRIQAEQAWDITAGSPDVVVAVIDTGIDPDHPDLFANLWHNPREIPGNGRDDDSNGYVDDTWGWNFDSLSRRVEDEAMAPTRLARSRQSAVTGFGNDREPSDGHGHGTHVAGTIAAVGNNGQGIVGVAWRCQVMAVKGLNDFGFGFSDDLAQAIRYAADNGAKVINMSWGGEGKSGVLEDVLRYAHDTKGAVLVAAAGNSNVDALGFTPANIEQVITVAATDRTDHRAPWSNYGAKIDVAAPGGDGQDADGSTRAGANILSCRANGTDLYGDGSTLLGEYLRARGTSMAAPHVAGLCALVLARQPEFTNEDVRNVLRVSADDILDPLNDGTAYTGPDPYTGAGRVNASRALTVPLGFRARITAPLSHAVLSAPAVDIYGTASAPAFQRYVVAYGLGNAPQQWVEIAQSMVPVTEGVLARWEIANLAYATYTIRLQVWQDSFAVPAESRVVVLKSYLLAPGWPVSLHRSSPSDSPTLVAVADLDGDGPLELVVWQRTFDAAYLDDVYTVHVFDQRGRERPGWPIRLEKWVNSFAMGDLTGDGTLECLFVGQSWDYSSRSYCHRLWILNPDGTAPPGWPRQFMTPHRIVEAPHLIDVDHDHVLEIVLQWRTSEGALALAIVRADGTLLQTLVLGLDETLFTTADLEGDGLQEFVTVKMYTDADYRGVAVVSAYRVDGSLVFGWPVMERASFHCIDVVDLDSDGDDEIIAINDSGDCYAWSGEGRSLPGWPIGGSYPMAVADLDGDGLAEILGQIIAANSGERGTAIWRLDGTLMSGWPQLSSRQSDVLDTVMPVDLDRDGMPEIIRVFSSDRVVTAFRLTGETLQGWPPIIPGWGWPSISTGQGGFTSWPAFGDVDGDGLAEVVLAGWNQVVAIRPDGSFPLGFPLDVPGAYNRLDDSLFTLLKLLDMDNDGSVDLLAAWPPHPDLHVLLWNLHSGPLLPVNERPTIPSDLLAGRGIDGNIRSHALWVYPQRFANGERGTLVLQLKAKDGNHDRVTYRIQGLPAEALFNDKKGFFKWRPTPEQAGTYRVTFSVSDGEATTSETITITVRAGNKKPVLTLPGTSYTMDEGQPLEFTLQATDPDGDRIQFLGTDLPRWAALDRATGRFTWRPDFTQAGSYLLSVAASDGSLEDRQTIRMTVRNVNRPPTLTNPGAFTIKEGQILEFLLNALDPDGDPLTFSATNLPGGATLVQDTGLFSWQPTFQQGGNYSPITVTVSDGAASATLSFTITVQDTPPWIAIPNKPVVNMTQIRTPTNVAAQVLTGTKAAYTAVLITGVEVVPRDRFTTWKTTVTLAEGDNALEIRARDVAGLMSDPVRTTIALDTALPDLTVTTPMPGQIIPLPSS